MTHTEQLRAAVEDDPKKRYDALTKWLEENPKSKLDEDKAFMSGWFACRAALAAAPTEQKPVAYVQKSALQHVCELGECSATLLKKANKHFSVALFTAVPTAPTEQAAVQAKRDLRLNDIELSALYDALERTPQYNLLRRLVTHGVLPELPDFFAAAAPGAPAAPAAPAQDTQAIRRAALEEAAEVCVKTGDQYSRDGFVEETTVAYRCSRLVRALIDQPVAAQDTQDAKDAG